MFIDKLMLTRTPTQPTRRMFLEHFSGLTDGVGLMASSRFAQSNDLAIVMALFLCGFLYSILGYLYYHRVEVKCPWCQYFNCINIKYITGSDHFCDNTGQKLSQWLPI
ncbi:unnamed protein product [Angiostrongylus costaricensis]|uniref:VKc domain-containing protein n=1 Tax=Angiostrongylus costaricensis TaxID=334426 RepID=A0A0R3PSI7_ANGCS|nr:unnamed protein product [Angiostrongylus costaricensis]